MFVSVFVSVQMSGAEQDVQSDAAENSGAHFLCFQRVCDRGAAARQRRPQQHFLALRKVTNTRIQTLDLDHQKENM